jgi:murein DD-endopeptidase MepM/ murein hydrolase activator NlpD
MLTLAATFTMASTSAPGCGAPVVSSKLGTVSAYWDSLYGNVIDVNDGEDLERYAHLSSYAVNAGQWVNQGDVLGYVGSTGNSTGCHLHFEVRWSGWDWAPVDPLVPLNAQ